MVIQRDLFSCKQKEWEVSPSRNQKKKKTELKKDRPWYHKCGKFLSKMSNSKTNKPPFISNVLVLKQATAVSLTYDIKVGITEPLPEVLGFYLFIFSKAVDFWGLVGLLSSSPIPSFHVGFKSIYCCGRRKPKIKIKIHLYANGGCGSSDANWISYVHQREILRNKTLIRPRRALFKRVGGKQLYNVGLYENGCLFWLNPHFMIS